MSKKQKTTASVIVQPLSKHKFDRNNFSSDFNKALSKNLNNKLNFETEDDLLIYILAWDFNLDLSEEYGENDGRITSKIKWPYKLYPLQTRFENINEYIFNLFPLFLIECSQILYKAKTLNNDEELKFEVRFSNVDKCFLQLTLIVDGNKSSQSLMDQFSTSDLVFLKIESISVIAYVKQSFSPSIRVELLIHPINSNIIAYNTTDLDRFETLQRIFARSTSKQATEKVYVSLKKLISITTLIREFKSLCKLNDLVLKDWILGNNPQLINSSNADSFKLENEFCNIPDELRNTLLSKYNKGQLNAIKNSLKENGITLIQGPPGSGKTTTIIGIVSCILNSKRFKGPSQYHDVKHHIKRMGSAEPKRNGGLIMFDTLPIDEHINIYDCMKVDKNNGAIKGKIFKVTNEVESIKRVLICAPSNAAVDEIVKRLTKPIEQGGGLYGSDGNKFSPIVTRVGPNIHPDLIEYSLEVKADKILKLKNGATHFKSEIKQNILMQSQIICATLSVCGSADLLGFKGTFDALIVDEATQGVELSNLIAISLGSIKRVILVGDPCQLPATVCSRFAIHLGYNKSLFQRLEACGHFINLLNVQYRMCKEISKFPSETFYHGKLEDYEHIDNIRPLVEWYTIPLLKPTMFFSIDSKEERSETSYINEMEVELTCQLIDIILLFTEKIPKESVIEKIGIITPYSAQVSLLTDTISKRFRGLGTFDISTVDGFQGREKDIVIFSAVRTLGSGSVHAEMAKVKNILLSSESLLEDIDLSHLNNLCDKMSETFISDQRRINVGITRARSNLFIIGNPYYLLDHLLWLKLYYYYKKNDLIFHINPNVFDKSENNTLCSYVIRYLKSNPELINYFSQISPRLSQFLID